MAEIPGQERKTQDPENGEDAIDGEVEFGRESTEVVEGACGEEDGNGDDADGE